MSAEDPVGHFLSLHTLAVVGASRDKEKYGHIVFTMLRERGYDAVPINPTAPTVAGVRAYADLGSVPRPVEGVVFVVPPAATERVLAQADRHGIRHFWMQPGAESPAALEYAREHGLTVIYDECIMVAMVTRLGGQ